MKKIFSCILLVATMLSCTVLSMSLFSITVPDEFVKTDENTYYSDKITVNSIQTTATLSYGCHPLTDVFTNDIYPLSDEGRLLLMVSKKERLLADSVTIKRLMSTQKDTVGKYDYDCMHTIYSIEKDGVEEFVEEYDIFTASKIYNVKITSSNNTLFVFTDDWIMSTVEIEYYIPPLSVPSQIEFPEIVIPEIEIPSYLPEIPDLPDYSTPKTSSSEAGEKDGSSMPTGYAIIFVACVIVLISLSIILKKKKENKASYNSFKPAGASSVSKCAMCLKVFPSNSLYKLEEKTYCNDCYNKMRASLAPNTTALDDLARSKAMNAPFGYEQINNDFTFDLNDHFLKLHPEFMGAGTALQNAHISNIAKILDSAPILKQIGSMNAVVDEARRFSMTATFIELEIAKQEDCIRQNIDVSDDDTLICAWYSLTHFCYFKPEDHPNINSLQNYIVRILSQRNPLVSSAEVPSDKFIGLLKNYSLTLINSAELNTISGLKEVLSYISTLFTNETNAEQFKTMKESLENGTDTDKNNLWFRTAFEINKIIRLSNSLFEIKKSILNQETEMLCKTWIALDFYAYPLKPEHNKHITDFKNIVANVLATRNIDFAGTFKSRIIKFTNQEIHIDSSSYYNYLSAVFYSKRPPEPLKINGKLALFEKTPVIKLYDDGVLVREYCLQTTGDEDFTGKQFNVGVILSLNGKPPVPAAQIDGFISEQTDEELSMKMGDIGFRMEAYFLISGKEDAKQRYEALRGQDLVPKALKYPGYTTPLNVRLIGICPECKKSFAFTSYNFPMMQSEPAYSDDGLDVMDLSAYKTEETGFDKENWSCTVEGKTFRYYNSFNCPHCGEPYIDYKKFPQNKGYGNLGCAFLGNKVYREQDAVGQTGQSGNESIKSN